MRIAYLVSQYPAVNHTFILREILQLRSLGWDIQTISVRACDRPVSELSADEAEERSRTIYLLPARLADVIAKHLTVFLRRPVAYFATLFYALRLGHTSARQVLRNVLYFAEAVLLGWHIRHHSLGHVHVHFASTLALLVHRLQGTPFSMTIHGSDIFIDPVGQCLQEKVEAAKLVVAISKFARSQLMRFCPREEWQKIEVIYLGVDPEMFRPSPRPADPDVFHLICVGRLAGVKGHHVLLAALARLHQQQYRVRLSFVGDGPDLPALEEHVAALGISDLVEFHGNRNQGEVQRLLATADVFVLASFAEGVPVVLMEAMATCLPCVATRVTGVPELISDGVEGLLVTPSAAEELAAAVALLLDSNELRERLAAAGRKKVLQQHDLIHNAAQLSKTLSTGL